MQACGSGIHSNLHGVDIRLRELVFKLRNILRGLQLLLDKYCPQIPGYFLYYPSRLNLAPKLKVLIDFLKKSDSPRRTAR